MKGQNEILTRTESRHTSRPNVFYFLHTAHFLKQLPTHIAHIAKAPQANATTKALTKSAILPTHKLKLAKECNFAQTLKKII